MEKAPQKEGPNVIDVQLKINKEIRGLLGESKEKKKLPNSGDLDNAERVLQDLDELLKNENVQNSKEDFEDLTEKRAKLVAFIDHLQQELERVE